MKLTQSEFFLFSAIDTMKLKSTQLAQKHLTLQVSYMGVGDSEKLKKRDLLSG